VGALAVVAIAAMAACSPSKAVPPETALGEPEITKSPAAVDVQALRLPLDTYRLIPEERLMVARARALLFQRCMQRFGFRVELPDPGPAGPGGANARRYGLVDEPSATKYGYHPPPSEDHAPALREPSLGPAERAVASGQGPSRVGAHEVPMGGCNGEAARMLVDGAPEPVNPRLVENLTIESSDRSERDSRLLAGFSAWSGCMERAGYHYRSPWDVNDDPMFQTEHPTDREIATATADVRCKKEVKLIDLWAAVDSAYQEWAIDQHREQLGIVRRNLDVTIGNAKRLLSEAAR
jgi:hypothetical protein